MNKAFVLGAGLGTRLKPLTLQLPKPLIPFYHQPLMDYAFAHLKGVGIREFIVNTHHLAEEYEVAYPADAFESLPITFRHESTLLETAGGIANIQDCIGTEPFLVYNGDILTTLPLEPLIEMHKRDGNLVTLVLRSEGPAQHIAFDQDSSRVIDIRNRLGTGREGEYQFTGIYAVNAEFFNYLTPGKVESVIPVWLDLIRSGKKVGGVVCDEGEWWDLGDRQHYLSAHHFWANHGWKDRSTWVHPEAKVSPEAKLRGVNVISKDVVIEAGAELEDCVIWEGAHIGAQARLKKCIVRRGISVNQDAENQDF